MSIFSWLDDIAKPLMVASTAMDAAGTVMAWKASRESGEAAAATTLAESQLAAHSYLEQGAALAEAGEAERMAARFEAGQLVTLAGQERAAAQRRAEEETRQAALIESRAIALAAASGAGGVSDPTVARLLGQLHEEGEYKALTAMYEGESLARGLELEAKVRKWEGRQAYRAGQIALQSSKRKAAMVLESSGRVAGMQLKAGNTAGTATLVSGFGGVTGRFAEYLETYG